MTVERTTLNDPVLRLCEYWFRARLLHAHVHDMREAYDCDINAIFESGAWHDFDTYLSFWLSSLFVVAEGYRELKLSDPKLDKLLAKHFDDLRLFRHGTFHFQRNNKKGVDLLRQLNWAEKLHVEFRRFLKRYIKNTDSIISPAK